MKKSLICILSVAFALCVTAVWAIDAHNTQQGLADKMIRLHVLANSDSEADQALKLEVRDAVLAQAEDILRRCGTMEEAQAQLEAALPDLEALGEAAVSLNGCDYPVTAALSWEDYPTREYDTFTLPAGRYLSLRLTIGAGEGRNWWCVVFPPLCNAVTREDFTGSAEAAGLTEEEVALITQESRGYVVRFKVVELVENWLAALG